MPFDKTITTRDKWQVPRTLGDETLKPVTKIDDSRFNTGDSNRLLSVSPGETGTVEGINQTQTVQGGNMTYQPTEDGSGQENELIDKSQDVETLGTDEVVVQTPTMNFISGETGTDGTGSTDGSTTLFDDSSGDQTGQADGDPSMDLKLQGDLSEGGSLVRDFWEEGARTGSFNDVENTRRLADAENDQYEYKRMKMARDRATQAGLQPGTAGYEQMMQQAMADVNQKRLGSEQQANQMQGQYRREAMNALGNIEQQDREFAIGERGFEFQRDDIDYMREQSDEIKDDASANQFLDNIKDPKARQHLERVYLDGGLEALKAEMNNVLGEYGTITDEYASQTPSENETEAFNADMDKMLTNPDTGADWEAGEKEAYKAQMWDAHLRDKYGMNAKERDEFNAEQDANDMAQGVIDGTANVNDITGAQWDGMDKKLMTQITEPFNTGMKFLRTGDFAKSGLKADSTTERVDEGEITDSGHGAGEGNGSVIMFEGKPYRITRYYTVKDTDGDNERRGKVYAVALSGEEEGKEKLVSSTGWQDI